jgi:hypothetical protein
MRPGERPYWADASPWEADWAGWRQGALDAGVSLDVAVACLVEYDLTLTELERWIDQPAAELRQAAQRELASPRLAPDAEFRDWLELLKGGLSTMSDELPDIVLPVRLMRSAVVRAGWGSRVAPTRLRDALTCERAAAGRSLTLEGWGLRVGLNALSTSGAG